MGAEAQESVDLQSLTFDQLAEAAQLAARTLQKRPGSDERVMSEYFAASNHSGISTASICRGFDEKYCIFFNPSVGCVAAESFATVEEADERLRAVLIENGYRIM